jgi:hypothetical protein
MKSRQVGEADYIPQFDMPDEVGTMAQAVVET